MDDNKNKHNPILIVAAITILVQGTRARVLKRRNAKLTRELNLETKRHEALRRLALKAYMGEDPEEATAAYVEEMQFLEIVDQNQLK